MAGCCWRLLAAFLLIFIAPTFLIGQDAAERLPARSPAVAPDLPPPLSPSAPVAPVWIPPPNLPRPYPIIPGTIGLQQNVLQQLVHSAGMIFSGRVISVGRATSSLGPDQASTAITFQVEHAIHGTSPNQTLTIHEWAGLWPRGERYHVGDRVLLFLYNPSKLGLTSPVAGALGRFALDSQGKIVMDPQHFAVFAVDPMLGGKTVVPYPDFALAVRHYSREE
jgi:hypothetical protein